MIVQMVTGAVSSPYSFPRFAQSLLEGGALAPCNSGKFDTFEKGKGECADRELNPGYELGKLMSYH
jgi:hypothetical protein